jgi:hypothetical protein
MSCSPHKYLISAWSRKTMAAMYYLEITVLYFKLCRCKSSVLQPQIKFMKMRHLLYLFKFFLWQHTNDIPSRIMSGFIVSNDQSRQSAMRLINLSVSKPSSQYKLFSDWLILILHMIGWSKINERLHDNLPHIYVSVYSQRHFYPLASEVAKGYSNATFRPSFRPSVRSSVTSLWTL